MTLRMSNSGFALLLMLSGVVHSVTIEFYWTNPSKISKPTLKDLLLPEILTYCNSTVTTRQRCSLPVSGVLNEDSVLISDPIQSGINVAVDINARYTLNATYYHIPESSISDMLKDEAVRTRISDGVGHWIEMVGETQYRIKADPYLNLVISVSVSVFTLILLIITLLLRKREEDLKEEKRKLERRNLKQSDKSYKVRPGPEPIERWPSVRRCKGPDSNKVSPEPTPPVSTISHKVEPEHFGGFAQQHPSPYAGNGMTASSAIPGLNTKLPPLVESDVSASPTLEYSSKMKAKKKRKQKLEKGREKTTSEKVVEITELDDEDMERSDGRSSPVTEEVSNSGTSNEAYRADESHL